METSELDTEVLQRARQLIAALPVEVYPGAQADRLARLVALLAGLPPPPDPVGLYPRWPELQGALLRALDAEDAEAMEQAFLLLYEHVHGKEAPYTPGERQQVDASGGYWCHAGGLAPILRAGEHLRPDSRSADYGAGNGLQCLLMQWLTPHRCSLQIEISSRMVEAGQALQDWLKIPTERIAWQVADVAAVPPLELDFIYLYRPLRPIGPGRAFYRGFADALETQDRPVVIFSIADALGEFLSPRFETFYTDGHLRCFRRR